MAYRTRQYRSYAEFEREELHESDHFVQSLDEFHRTAPEEEVVDLFDAIDEKEKEEEDEEEEEEEQDEVA